MDRRRCSHCSSLSKAMWARPVWRSTPGGIGSWRRRENSVRFVGSRLREKARALVSGQFRVTDVLLPRREQSLKFRFRVLEFRYDQGVAWREEVRERVGAGYRLVAGVAGQLGSVGRTVTGLLLDRGFPVRAMVRREDERAASLRAAGAQVVVGDLLEPGDVYRVVSGCSRVYFSMSPSAGYLEATVTMAAVAREAGVNALVKMSQMQVSEMSIQTTTPSHQA